MKKGLPPRTLTECAVPLVNYASEQLVILHKVIHALPQWRPVAWNMWKLEVNSVYKNGFCQLNLNWWTTQYPYNFFLWGGEVEIWLLWLVNLPYYLAFLGFFIFFPVSCELPPPPALSRPDFVLSSHILPVSVLNQFIQSYLNKEGQIIVVTLLLWYYNSKEIRFNWTQFNILAF